MRWAAIEAALRFFGRWIFGAWGRCGRRNQIRRVQIVFTGNADKRE
jgi:hypothetical protein